MKKIVLFIVSIFVLSSCATTKVKVNSTFPGSIQTESLNLVSTMIGPVYQPVLPLIDASIFNEKTNKIASQILDEEQKMVDSYKETLASDLSGKLGVAIKTAEDFDKVQADKYRVSQGIQIENKNFPLVHFGSQDLNVTSFGKGRNVYDMFSKNAELRSRILELYSDLKLNNAVISFNRIAVIGVGSFGLMGNVRLESYLFLYNSNGDLILDAYGYTKPTSIKGKTLNDYKSQLDKFEEISGLMSQELAKYISK